MKTVILSDHESAADAVYGRAQRERITMILPLFDGNLTKAQIIEKPELVSDCEYIFSTWGMPRFTGEEIKQYFPKLKAVLYAAGSVQGFAREFLENDILVSSAFMANGIPVAEFTFGQILLALKGFFSVMNIPKKTVSFPKGFDYDLKGQYHAKVGICGAGAIGSMVCEKLKSTDCDVMVFDKFLSRERAEELNVQLCSLEEIFSECDVISNHLANKVELNNIFNYELFSKMKPCSTFINTGRGAQVNEDDLVRAMNEDSSRMALLDVTDPEPMHEDSPMVGCPNIIVTPHIAGSIGIERHRLADWVIDEFLRLIYSQPQKYGVTLEMLKTMA